MSVKLEPVTNPNPLNCDECEYEATSFQDLSAHCTHIHSYIACFVCPLCTKVFSDELEINKHFHLTHPNWETEKYRDNKAGNHLYHHCELCPRQFDDSLKLEIHKGNVSFITRLFTLLPKIPVLRLSL